MSPSAPTTATSTSPPPTDRQPGRSTGRPVMAVVGHDGADPVAQHGPQPDRLDRCRSSARNYAQVQAEMPEGSALAGGRQGVETFAAARQAGDRGGQA